MNAVSSPISIEAGASLTVAKCSRRLEIHPSRSIIMYSSLCFVYEKQLWYVILVSEIDPYSLTPRYNTETAGALYVSYKTRGGINDGFPKK